MPVFRTDPSNTLACWSTSALGPVLLKRSCSSFTSENALSKVVPGLSGTRLAMDEVSGKDKSMTRPASFIADLAAMVP